MLKCFGRMLWVGVLLLRFARCLCSALFLGPTGKFCPVSTSLAPLRPRFYREYSLCISRAAAGRSQHRNAQRSELYIFNNRYQSSVCACLWCSAKKAVANSMYVVACPHMKMCCSDSFGGRVIPFRFRYFFFFFCRSVESARCLGCGPFVLRFTARM